ncbi:hypothetical protein Slala02_06370 [Streptomyces lavendulae subsp. lavendulae]|nr:hypothetical protein Slala01_09680 [Streptomyces lavendulae subsp. lavendulae]GLX24817.1 hypothetical protein Slala02_06370 [Streptomyces lavendulae subsp. lavendulae]
MPTRPRTRPLPPDSPWYRTLVIAVLGALLLAALACSSHGHTDVSYGSPAAGAALESRPTAPAEPLGHAHPHPGHGAGCAASDPAPAGPGPAPLSAGPARPSAAPAAAPVDARAAPWGAGGPAVARSGRSTLTIVCRWRL